MEAAVGFSFKDFKSWKSFVSLLHQPRDASILAYSRIVFGFLMLVDIPQERGMTRSDMKFGDDSEDICQFPMFSQVKQLSADYMVLLYVILIASAFGIMLGFCYRLSCFGFTCIYWYIFLLDKSTWNNHSYLYGLFGFLFLLTDAHRYASVDSLFQKKLHDSHVSLWNYTLLKFQIFLVYFYAGLKKTELDWLMGYSMHKLTRHWVFDPIRIFLSEATMDLVVVHYGGFLLDISAGFLLFFDKTRYIGFLLCGSFHAMNSQLFNIGMFPYMMLGTMFTFCSHASFKTAIEKCLCRKRTNKPVQRNPSCVYVSEKEGLKDVKISWRQTLAAVFTVLYIAEQLFLPYSHFITKGYNGWTQGPYGYSWDMMVHSFSNQHIKITYRDKYGKEGYLKPGAFLRSSKGRWSAHPDMTIQYARCLKERLIELGIEDPSIYFDVWKSLNGRFQQRVIDPTVDLANYDWSPFKPATFVLPVLSKLSDWREKLLSMKSEFKNQTLNVVFVADFPGLPLENFVQADFINTTVEVLEGRISVAIDSSAENVTLSSGERSQVPEEKFHIVTTVSEKPSCYFYVYHNTTEQALLDRLENYKKKTESNPSDSLFDTQDEDPLIVDLYEKQQSRKRLSEKRRFTDNLVYFTHKKLHIFRRSYLVSFYAIRNILFGKPDAAQLQNERMYMDEWLFAKKTEQQEQTDDHQLKTEL